MRPHWEGVTFFPFARLIYDTRATLTRKEVAEPPRMSRRKFLVGAGVATAGFAVGYAAKSLNFPFSEPSESAPSTPDEALAMLARGNQRFAAGGSIHPNQSVQLRQSLVSGQAPWAAVLSCIDSRAPPEIIFDRGLGDIFVSRTAGQVIDAAVQGSLEYTVEEAGVLLVMVLGHENCGAVKATISALQGSGHAPGEIDALVQAIKPAVQSASGESGDLLDNSVRANIQLEVQALKTNSEIIASAVDSGALKLVGAYYGLDTGLVSVITQ